MSHFYVACAGFYCHASKSFSWIYNMPIVSAPSQVQSMDPPWLIPGLLFNLGHIYFHYKPWHSLLCYLQEPSDCGTVVPEEEQRMPELK